MKEIFISYTIGRELNNNSGRPDWLTFKEFLELNNFRNPNEYLTAEFNAISYTMMYYNYFHVRPSKDSGKGMLYMGFNLNYSIDKFLEIYENIDGFNYYFDDLKKIFEEIKRISALRIDFITADEMKYLIKYTFRGICSLWFETKDGFSHMVCSYDLLLRSQFHHSTDLKHIFSYIDGVLLHVDHHINYIVEEYFGEVKNLNSLYSLID